MDRLFQDIRYGLRRLRRRPGWAAAIVIALAVGIGANCSMFSGFEAWVLRPLDFDDPDRLVVLNEIQETLGRGRTSVSAGNLGNWMSEQRSFSGYGAFDRHRFNINDDDNPIRVDGAKVSAGLFPLLGRRAVRGRGFTPREDIPGAPAAVALISDDLWRTRYPSGADLASLVIRLDGRPHQIVGVMPPGFKFPEWAEVWTPLGIDADSAARGDRNLNVIARLAPGVTIESARGELKNAAARLESLFPETNRGWSAEVTSLRVDLVPPIIRTALTSSMGAGILVLLVICANVAGLLLAQASARSRETALRSALGAKRGRLVQQSLTEGVLLALPAGGLGLLMGLTATQEMLAWVPVDPPYLFAMTFTPSVGFFTLGISLAAGLICGMVPLLRSSGIDAYQILKSPGARGGSGHSVGRLRNLLVAGELALSTALLIGALLMVKSFLAMHSVDRGYESLGLLTTDLSLARDDLKDSALRTAALERIRSELAQIPGVEAVGIVSSLPASNRYRIWALQLGLERIEEDIQATAQAVSGDYFETMKIPLLAGRTFNAAEHRDGGDAVLVSRGLALRLWGGIDVVGRRLKPSGDEEWMTVAGVVGDVDYGRDMVVSGQIPEVQLYLPYGRLPVEELSVAIKTPLPPSQAAERIRRAVQSAVAGVPMSEVLTMDQAVFRVRWVSGFFSRQLAAYAFMATFVAALGLYGLATDSVSGRTRELAVRMALGARREDLVRLVVRESLVIGLFGVLTGLALALALTGFISGMLQGITARDPWVFAVVAILFLAITLLAAYFPARRAAMLDPITALRAD